LTPGKHATQTVRGRSAAGCVLCRRQLIAIQLAQLSEKIATAPEVAKKTELTRMDVVMKSFTLYKSA